MNQQYRTNGWRKMRHGDFSEGYHTYVLEWSPDFMYVLVTACEPETGLTAACPGGSMSIVALTE